MTEKKKKKWKRVRFHIVTSLGRTMKKKEKRKKNNDDTRVHRGVNLRSTVEQREEKRD